MARRQRDERGAAPCGPGALSPHGVCSLTAGAGPAAAARPPARSAAASPGPAHGCTAQPPSAAARPLPDRWRPFGTSNRSCAPGPGCATTARQFRRPRSPCASATPGAPVRPGRRRAPAPPALRSGPPGHARAASAAPHNRAPTRAALRFVRRDQLTAGLAPARLRPCRAHKDERVSVSRRLPVDFDGAAGRNRTHYPLVRRKVRLPAIHLGENGLSARYHRERNRSSLRRMVPRGLPRFSDIR